MTQESTISCRALFLAKDWSTTAAMGRSPELRAVIGTMMLAPTGVCITIGTEMHMFYNDEYAKILGSKHPEALGQPLFDVVPEVRSQLETGYRAIMTEGRLYIANELLVILERPSLVEAYFTFTGSPLLGNDGSVLGIYFIVTETTHNVKSRRRLSTLRELAECGTKVAKAFDASVESTASSCMKILEKNGKDIPFGALYLFDNTETAILAGSCGVTLEEQRRHHFPDRVPMRSTATEDAQRDPWRLGACARGDLSSSHILLTNVTDTHGTITLQPWNRAPNAARVYSLCIPSSQQPIGAVILGQSPMIAEDSDDRDYVEYLEMLVNSLTAALASAKASNDERCRLAELQALNEAKSAFMANVSHEFRTPLTLILSPLEDLLVRSEQLPRQIVESLSLMQQNAVRLLHMVNNLLDFAASEARALSMNCELINLRRFTLDILGQFEYAIRSAQLSLDVNDMISGGMPLVVLFDRGMWEKIVVNLIANAIKYTQAGGEIRVSFRVDSDGQAQKLYFVVKDSGIGISRDALPHIFERFYRVRQQRANYTEGTGIGLALVKELIVIHGGAIRVESELGKGSTFIVELPPMTGGGADATVVTAPSQFVKHAALIATPKRILSSSDVLEASTDQSPARFATILIVDDNEQMVQYVGGVLSKSGTYALRFARNGRDALECIQRDGKPDLLLSDVMMPVMDGITLLRALRGDSNLADLPIILMSARGTEQSKLAGIADGADDYLVKPFSSAELLIRVKSTIDLNRTRRVLTGEREVSMAKDKFVSVLSHELRNPLSAVLLIAEMLAADEALPIKVRENALLIQGSVKVEVELIDELLDCAQLACGSLKLQLVSVDLHALFRQALQSAQCKLQNKRLVVVEELYATNFIVMADEARLSQVFVKLLDNAIRATPIGGQITLRTRKEASALIITIQDTGYGIPASDLPLLFERFFATRRLAGGLGLGLFLAKSFLYLMRGTVTVSSDGDGRGTCFTLTLPTMPTVDNNIMTAAATNKRPRSGSADVGSQTKRSSLAGLRVLLVEDNPTTLLIMRRLLQDAFHCEVAFAESKQDALRLFRTQRFDLLLSDIGLPDGNGWELMQQLRQEQPSLLGIAVSGYGTSDDLQRSRAAGFAMHMTKPIGLTSLRETLSQVVLRETYLL